MSNIEQLQTVNDFVDQMKINGNKIEYEMMDDFHQTNE